MMLSKMLLRSGTKLDSTIGNLFYIHVIFNLVKILPQHIIIQLLSAKSKMWIFNTTYMYLSMCMLKAEMEYIYFLYVESWERI